MLSLVLELIEESNLHTRRYLGIVDAQSDADAVDDWLDGYIVELILSMDT